MNSSSGPYFLKLQLQACMDAYLTLRLSQTLRLKCNVKEDQIFNFKTLSKLTFSIKIFNKTGFIIISFLKVLALYKYFYPADQHNAQVFT